MKFWQQVLGYEVSLSDDVEHFITCAIGDCWAMQEGVQLTAI